MCYGPPLGGGALLHRLHPCPKGEKRVRPLLPLPQTHHLKHTGNVSHHAIQPFPGFARSQLLAVCLLPRVSLVGGVLNGPTYKLLVRILLCGPSYPAKAKVPTGLLKREPTTCLTHNSRRLACSKVWTYPEARLLGMNPPRCLLFSTAYPQLPLCTQHCKLIY